MSDYRIHALDSSFERVRRADEHLSELRQRFKAIREKQANSIGTYFRPHPPHHIIAEPFKEHHVTMRVGVAIGEICYNLKTALDYLIFELAELDSGSEQKDTQFPIMDAREDFIRDAQRRWLKGVNATHVAHIERLQPYNGCNWTKILRDLSNTDKHRQFANIDGESAAFGYSRIADGNFDSIDAPIRRAIHPVHGEVDVKVYVTMSIKFRNGTPVIETLEEIKTGVAQTLRDFKPEF